MAKFLRYVGRAWSFALRHLEGKHFIVNDCQSVPKLMFEMSRQLAGQRTLKHMVVDIEGMYPHMPKPVIRITMRDILNTVR